MRRPRARALRTGLAAAWTAAALASAASAQIVVLSPEDAGPDTLRAAITAAPPNSTIVLRPVPNDTIVLESDLDPLRAGVTIDARAASSTAVSGAGFRILGITNGDATVIDFGTGSGLFEIGDDRTLTFTAEKDTTVGATIDTTPTGHLVKDGMGTLELTGVSVNFLGDLTIEEGTVVGNTVSLPGTIANDTVLIFNQPADGTYAGDISGKGSVEKRAAGLLTLTGTNTYTGGTTITAGGLAGASSSFTGDIVNEAMLQFLQGAVDGSFDGRISGSGSVSKAGTGDLTLLGANTYTGGTHVVTGRLIGGTSSFGSGTIDLDGTTTLVFMQAGSGTFAGSITGMGAVEKDGAGAVRLSGSNTYSGGTTVTAGTLIVSSSNLPLTGGATDATVMGAGTLQFNQGSSGTFDGVIDGTGAITKTGSGTLTLTADQPFTGTLSINQGTLALTATLMNPVTVGGGGTLSGTDTGMVNDLVTVNGTLSPGLGGIDTFHVDDVTFAAGSRFAVDVADDGTGDLLDVANTATIDPNATLAVTLAPGAYAAPVSVQILTSSGLAGQFQPPPSFAFLDVIPSYVGNDVFLDIAPNGASIASFAQTRNQIAVSGALDTLNQSDPQFAPLFDSMRTLTAAEVPAALDDLSGEGISAFTTARQALAERTQRSLHRHMRSVLFEDEGFWPRGGAAPTTMRRTGSDVAAPVPLGERGMRAWLDGYGIFGDLDGDGNSADAEYDVYGATGGFDLRVGEHVLAGGAVGYAYTHVDVSDRNTDGDANTAQGALYAAWANSLVYAGVTGRYAWSTADSHRDIDIGSLHLDADGSFDSHDYGVRGEVAVNALDTGGIRLQPLAAFDWGHLSRESFNESGAGAIGLDVDSESLDSALLQLGGRADMVFGLSEQAVLVPELRAFWLNEFGDRDRRVEAAIGGAPFTVKGAEVSSSSGLFGIGWTVSIGRNVRATADYDVRLGSDLLEHAAGVTVEVRF